MKRIVALLTSIGFLFVGLSAAAVQRDELEGTPNSAVRETITEMTGISIEILAIAIAFVGVGGMLLAAIFVWYGGSR